jgi:Rod binding domain-containing protein
MPEINPADLRSPAASLPRPKADLQTAARDFEALLLHQALKSGTRPLSEGGLLDGGSAGRLFRDLFLEEAARLATRDKGLGLGAEVAKAVGNPIEAEQ